MFFGYFTLRTEIINLQYSPSYLSNVKGDTTSLQKQEF